jgi:hypothetical protein
MHQDELGVRLVHEPSGDAHRLLRAGREVDRAQDLLEAHDPRRCNRVASQREGLPDRAYAETARVAPTPKLRNLRVTGRTGTIGRVIRASSARDPA